jgi:release factor glutamine methyltransferase
LTLREALARARPAGVARLDAQLLLSAVLGRPREWLLAHDDAALGAEALAQFDALLQRRADGEPVAYLLGEREFHGLVLHVGPAVLVPRPETEALVDWALDLLGAELAHDASPALADLGTGSGAIALAVRQSCPRARVFASDASADALAVARTNGERLGLAVQWLQGDWWQPYAHAQVPPLALALSNPPYIGASDPHLPALRHEPRHALVPPGGDGLAALRSIVAGAGAHVAPGGWLLLEHGHDHADAVASLLRNAGFAEVEHRRDLAGHRRCTGGRWPGRAATRLGGRPGTAPRSRG